MTYCPTNRNSKVWSDRMVVRTKMRYLV